MSETSKYWAISEQHEAFTAHASNDAERMVRDFFNLLDTNRDKLFKSNYYVENSWLHFDESEYIGRDAIHGMFRRLAETKHTFQKVVGVAVGPHIMTILVQGQVEIGGKPPRQFAQQWIVSQGKNIVNMVNFFDQKAKDAARNFNPVV